jgi:L-iditol 2-dehydrogenase
MKAMQGRLPGVVELEEVPVPALGRGEVLLEMRTCGLCGSDLSKIFALGSPATPASLGHELVGVVRAVGDGVSRFVAGDRVAVAHHVPCGRCRYCRHGSESMCPQFKATNLDPGGFAEFIRVPALHVERTTFRLPDSVPDEVGVFMEPLACALRAVKRSDVQPGDQIAVVGTGAMGLLVAQAVLLRGAKAICLDLREDRLQLARTFGVQAVINAAVSDPAMSLLDLTEGEGVDGAILTAVSASVLEAMLGALRAGGRINLFAEARGSRHLSLDLDTVWRRELYLIATYSTTPVELAEAMQLLSTGGVRVLPLVTHRFGLARFAEGLRLQRDGVATKVLFVPREEDHARGDGRL